MHDGLAVSRALGDSHLRAAGLISTPELSTWQMLVRQQDSFLALVSDGVTEVLSAAQVCQIAAATESGMTLSQRGPAVCLPPARSSFTAFRASGVALWKLHLSRRCSKCFVRILWFLNG